MSTESIPDKPFPSCAPHAPKQRTEAVLLRHAVPADAEALALLGGATFLESFTWMLPGADIVAHCAKNHTLASYTHYLAQPDTRITLAETVEGAVPIGYAMVCAPELPSFPVQATDLELKRIYCFSRFRGTDTPVMREATGNSLEVVPGMRTGQALLEAALASAHDLGATRLLLGTHAGNAQAIAFYRRNGFAEAGTRTFQVGTQVCCDLIFARVL